MIAGCTWGYEEDIRCVADAVQRGCQCMLLSATSSKAGGGGQARTRVPFPRYLYFGCLVST